VPGWFRDAKFGIFMHWGLYAVPAHASEWYEKHLYGNPDQSLRREKPGMVRIGFAAAGRIKIADEQPAFILQPGTPAHWRTAAAKSTSTL
jgi:hypothetical protein